MEVTEARSLSSIDFQYYAPNPYSLKRLHNGQQLEGYRHSSSKGSAR